MAKARRSKRDIVSVRAKRRLFVDDDERDENCKCVTAGAVFSDKLEDKYTDIMPFENPPHPYKTVVRSSKKCKVSEDTNDGKGISICAESANACSQTVQQPKTQTTLQDFFKAQKRVIPSPKTPRYSCRMSKRARRTKEEA